MKQSLTRKLISVGAILLIVLRLCFPKIIVDNTILILIIIAIIPWLVGIFKSIEFPSGHKIELQELENAADKLNEEKKTSNDVRTTEEVSFGLTKTSYLSVYQHDPNLAIVALRIEIEKRLKVLASLYNIKEVSSLTKITTELKEKGVIGKNSADALFEIIKLGNQAAHGAEVESDVADWVYNSGKEIIRYLNVLASKNYDINVEQYLNRALIVLEYEGDNVSKMALEILSFVKKVGYVDLIPADTIKMKTGVILTKLGALRETDEFVRDTWTRHVITPFGDTLHTFLMTR